MTKRQFREANQKAFISNAIVIIAMFALTVVEGILFQMTAAVFVCLAACVVGFIISLTGYLSAKDTKRGEVLILSGAMLAYFIIMLAQDNLMFFPFALPILFSAIVYLDIKVVLYGEAAMVVSYAICMVRKLMFAKGGPDVQQAILFTGVLILCCVGATETIFLLNKFNTENNKAIRDGAQKQKETGKVMTEIADNISVHFKNAKQSTDELKEIINASNASMKNIADSTESTAQSVTDQAAKVQEIQAQSHETDEKRVEMLQTSQEAKAMVEEGEETITSLRAKAENVSEASQITVESTKAVLNKVEEVQNIVGSIMSIAKQTNLLALNASIEAARAGDAGRGFAVVADEIRELSEQTNSASSEITRIIEELTADAGHAMESIDKTVASVNEQNGMIETAEDRFQKINTNVSNMISKFGEIGDGMQQIVESTNKISESISNLSATSEEVASLSNEGVSASDSAVAKFDEFNKALEEIYKEANQLTALQNEE